MKESYLIPKIVYERLVKNVPPNPAVTKTSIHPTLKKKNSIIPLNVQGVKFKNRNEGSNPSLQSLPPMTLPQTKIPYGRQLIEYIKDSSQISWDSDGNLFHHSMVYLSLD